VTPDLAERLKFHKAQLLSILQGDDQLVAEARAIIQQLRANGLGDLAEMLVEAWQERLSICTADGGLTLAEAQRVALDQIRQMLDRYAIA
jgi:hypothetical protein